MQKEKKKALVHAHEKILDVFMTQTPLQENLDLFHPYIMGWGTTSAEEVINLDGFRELIRITAEQSEGLGSPEFQHEILDLKILEEHNLGLLMAHFRIRYHASGEEISMAARFSSAFVWNGQQWQLLHFHGSIPAESDDAWHYDQYKNEMLKLQQKVDEQTADLREKNFRLEVEAASERVRSVAMGMQEPGDLQDIVVSMRSEFTSLGHEAQYFWYMHWLPDHYRKAMTSGDGSRIGMVMTLPRHIHRDIETVAQWEQSDDPYLVLPMDTEVAVDYVDKMISLGDFEQIDPQAPSLDDIRHIGGLTFIMARTSQGEIGYSLPGVVKDPPEEAIKTLVRFAGVFDLAYKRFEDLEKAENQAKESRIEASLERIRASTSAMQSSEDLSEIAVLIGQELRKLGFPELFESGYIEFLEDEQVQRGWMSDFKGKNMDSFQIPLTGDPILDERYESFKNQIPLLHQEIGGKDLMDYLDFVELGVTSENVKKQVHEYFEEYFKGTTHFYHSFFKNGALKIISQEELSPDQEKLLIRFTNVFTQAFARFNDLLVAEYQAYQSRVEASLERVRGMAAAMNHSDDLQQIAEAMFRELEILQINPLRYGLGMIDGEKKEAELWASTVDDGSYLDMMGTISLTWHPMLQQAFDIWDAQHEELVYELKGKELSDYYRKIGQINPDIPNLEKLQDPDNDIVQYASFFPFKTGALYAFTGGEPSEEGKSILKRFANVFEQAHTRFEDLQTAEKQARLIKDERDRLEIALKELRATQQQLIQQEKLASLGQLTAGIAHEIKNPLNFVNNFSELNQELIQELKDILDKPDREKQKDEIDFLLKSISFNQAKINDHGTRADSIVKSMLQHSRGGQGVKSEVEINGIIKEFVNLAFHGMRAAPEPINVDVQLDLDEDAGKLNLISEDFSRVIVNLCNNAFDAMREKAKKEKGYKPVLAARTRKNGSGIYIEIEDNGPGIPEDIKDKIMQPFFTTKKGTEGTGLGLSITNDIIKAHGGRMDIASEEGCTKILIELNQ